MISAARPRRRTAWLLGAAVTMIGLFAMHGLSAGHELLATGAAPSTAMTHLSYVGGDAHDQPAPAHPRAGGPVCAEAGCCGMSGHNECVARLHHLGIDLPVHALVIASASVAGA